MENDPGIHALLRRRSEIAGSILHLDAQVAKLRADLKHLDAALEIMGYVRPEAPPARKACTSGLFHRKELNRLLTVLLRASPEGMQASELAIAIARDKGWATDEKPFTVALTDKVSRALSKLKVQDRAAFENCEAGYIWRLTPPAASTPPIPATPDD